MQCCPISEEFSPFIPHSLAKRGLPMRACQWMKAANALGPLMASTVACENMFWSIEAGSSFTPSCKMPPEHSGDDSQCQGPHSPSIWAYFTLPSNGPSLNPQWPLTGHGCYKHKTSHQWATQCFCHSMLMPSIVQWLPLATQGTDPGC